jgi:stage II sporulation protein D
MYYWRSLILKQFFIYSLLFAVIALRSVPSCEAQDKFRKRNYHVRVSVISQAEELIIQPSGPYQLIDSHGTPLYQIVPGRPYYVQHNPGGPGERVYRLVLNKLDPDQVGVAIALAKAARDAYNMKVKVLRTRAQTGKPSRILVTVGSFETLDDAHQAKKKVKADKVNAIYEDHAPVTKGDVRLISGDGTLLAMGSRSIRLVPLYETSDSLKILKIKDGQWKRPELKKARYYRGELEFNLNDEGNLTAVNDLWIEYYIYSVVAAEIGIDAPVESMKAQAVAARSEAVAKIQRGIVSGDMFDFPDTSIAQTYKGKGVETQQVRDAVDATRGEILVSNGEAVDAVYSHSCGGYLANFQDLWGGTNPRYSVRKVDRLNDNVAPLLANHRDTHQWTTVSTEALCNPSRNEFPKYARKYYRWSKALSPDDLTDYVNTHEDLGRVQDVEIDKRAGSGRVQAIRLRGEKKNITIDRELKIRKVLGWIYSTFFTIEKDQDPDTGHLKELRIYGAGYGHGVGMCQMGAYMMGHAGYTYRQILGHYFDEVKMRRLYR